MPPLGTPEPSPIVAQQINGNQKLPSKSISPSKSPPPTAVQSSSPPQQNSFIPLAAHQFSQIPANLSALAPTSKVIFFKLLSSFLALNATQFLMPTAENFLHFIQLAQTFGFQLDFGQKV
jgi:hypothetical protein